MLKAIYTDIDQFSNDEIKSLLPHISEERRLFALQIKNSKRFAECVVSEALARVALSLASGIPAGDFVIGRGEKGKPFQTTVPGLFFNISHSNGLCLCAVSDSDVGADIEKSGRIKLKRAKAFLSERELAEYEKAVCDGDRALLATKFWCRKESYLKLLGTGFDRKPAEIDTVSLDEAVFDEGVINSDFWYCICRKKLNLGLDKPDQIAQSRPTLNLIKTQDIVVSLKKC